MGSSTWAWWSEPLLPPLVATMAGTAFAGSGIGAVSNPGVKNSAKATTTLSTTGSGPALSLGARTGKPPLAVSSTGLVMRLNADKLDGTDAAAARTETATRRSVSSSS